MRRPALILAITVLMVALVVGGIACGAEEGKLPAEGVGNQWVYNWTQSGQDYVSTFEVTGEDTVGGVGCWTVGVTFEPALSGYVSTMSMKIDKSSMLMMSMEYSFPYQGQTMSSVQQSTFEFPDGSLWPLKVGNEVRVIESSTTTEFANPSRTTTLTKTLKVEAKEDVTVEAGTFTCFKVVNYSEDGEVQETQWYSDKAKMFVKVENSEDGHTQELLSYSI